MYLYQLSCSRCLRERKYKTGIAPENFTDAIVPKCLCGGTHSVKLLTDNADNEISIEVEEDSFN